MITYRQIEARDIPEIAALFEEHLTGGGSISDAIKELWDKGDYSGAAALDDGKLVGFMTFCPGISFTYPHPDLEDEAAKAANGKKIAYCDAILVLPEYRVHGIAETLAKRSVDLLIGKGFELLLTEIWVYPDGTAPAKYIFESMGKAVYKKEVNDFYRDLDKHGMWCPVCGNKCFCGAWVEIMEL